MLTPEEIRKRLDEHQPYLRIAADRATACDRQWLRMLDDLFRDVEHQDIDRWLVTEFLGILALRIRLDA